MRSVNPINSYNKYYLKQIKIDCKISLCMVYMQYACSRAENPLDMRTSVDPSV